MHDGTVKTVCVDRGFGFIGVAGEPDIFFHCSKLGDGLDSLRLGSCKFAGTFGCPLPHGLDQFLRAFVEDRLGVLDTSRRDVEHGSGFLARLSSYRFRQICRNLWLPFAAPFPGHSLPLFRTRLSKLLYFTTHHCPL
jgi:hypothetical protein